MPWHLILLHFNILSRKQHKLQCSSLWNMFQESVCKIYSNKTIAILAFLCFPQPLKKNVKKPWTGYNCFLPHPFHFISHLSIRPNVFEELGVQHTKTNELKTLDLQSKSKLISNGHAKGLNGFTFRSSSVISFFLPAFHTMQWDPAGFSQAYRSLSWGCNVLRHRI
jgi:hypothetical protein